jgi:hypothetical protein
VFDAGSPWPAGASVLALLGAAGGWIVARLTRLALTVEPASLGLLGWSCLTRRPPIPGHVRCTRGVRGRRLQCAALGATLLAVLRLVTDTAQGGLGDVVGTGYRGACDSAASA